MVLDNLTDVSKSQTETFYVVYVPCRHAEEAVEYFFQVFFLDPDTIVFNGDQQFAVVVVPGSYHQCKGHLRTAVFHCVVHQVKQYIGDVHFIYINGRIDSLQVYIERTVVLFDFQGEGVGHADHQVVRIHFLQFESCFLPFEQRHLEHLLYQEAQSLRLIIYHA